MGIRFKSLVLFTAFILCFKRSVILGSFAADNLGYCEADKDCNGATLSVSKKSDIKYIFYDVNPAEGFNLRRDVYMRMAIFTHNLKNNKIYSNIQLVLPPFTNLYHWKSKDVGEQKQIPWSLFFDLDSLKTFAPVIELHKVFDKEKYIVFDRIFNLENYPDPFENGMFIDKWESKSDNDCLILSNFWGYNNITYKEIECLRYQGYAKMLRELLNLYPQDRMVLITNAQIPLHDEYGTKKYWNSRISMKFNKDLVEIARSFINNETNCDIERCDNYISVHWRREDFAKYRKKDVPSVEGTAKQIKNILKKIYNNKINTVFIATDSNQNDFLKLQTLLKGGGINVKYFRPLPDVKNKYKDGGVAIIDQIICSHASYFIGTHESTFSFRIQEEREILGFESDTTFNRLCPDIGECKRPSIWKIVQ